MCKIPSSRAAHSNGPVFTRLHARGRLARHPQECKGVCNLPHGSPLSGSYSTRQWWYGAVRITNYLRQSRERALPGWSRSMCYLLLRRPSRAGCAEQRRMPADEEPLWKGCG